MRFHRRRKSRSNEELEVIQSHLRGVLDLTRVARDDVLIYLIEMAYLEVSDRVRENFAAMPKHPPSNPPS